MDLKLLYILNQSYTLTTGAMIVPLRSVWGNETKRLAPFVLHKLEDGAGATRYLLIEAMFTAQNSPLRHNKLNPEVSFSSDLPCREIFEGKDAFLRLKSRRQCMPRQNTVHDE